MDDDLDLLRSYRAAEAEPPRGLQDRLEEDLLDAMLAASGAPAPAIPIRQAKQRTPSRSWRANLRRPVVAFVALAVLAGAVATVSNGGLDVSGTAVDSAGVTKASANPLEGAATSLFGASNVASTEADTPLVDRLDTSPAVTEATVLAAGPERASIAAIDALSRRPQRLTRLLREAPGELGRTDQGDRIAFHIAMAWISDTAAPMDLRAALLQSGSRARRASARAPRTLLRA